MIIQYQNKVKYRKSSQLYDTQLCMYVIYTFPVFIKMEKYEKLEQIGEGDFKHIGTFSV